jgi:membrane complex biogenesis BtpA family protein
MAMPLPFPSRRPVLIGMVHLPALPGAPGGSLDMDRILDRVRSEAQALADAGFDGVLVENFGDAPFYPDRVPAETVAGLTRAVVAAREMVGDLPVGVNVLRNDTRAALGIAAATGAAFIRVNVLAGTMWTDQGPIVGRAHEIARVRRSLVPECSILADVQVKHAAPTPGRRFEDELRDSWSRSGADALIVSGSGTGRATDPSRVEAARAIVPDAPLFVGSGATPENVQAVVAAGATGLIVGSWTQFDGRAGAGVDPKRARQFVEAAHGARSD